MDGTDDLSDGTAPNCPSCLEPMTATDTGWACDRDCNITTRPEWAPAQH